MMVLVVDLNTTEEWSLKCKGPFFFFFFFFFLFWTKLKLQ